MRVISRSTLRDYWEKDRNAEDALRVWFHYVKKADWKDWTDIKKMDPSLSPLGKDRYVFNIKGNTYRIITIINFKAKIVFIRFVGTHAEYDKIDARSV